MKGQIDPNYGIRIINQKGAYITNFVLDTGEKKYPVFFDDKIKLSSLSTVEVKGDMPYSARTKAEEISPKEKVIAETLRRIKAEAPSFKGEAEQSQIEDSYIIASEVFDLAQNTRYYLET